VFPPELRELIGVAKTNWVGECSLDFFGASESGR